jgi:PhoH-like ATPase
MRGEDFTNALVICDEAQNVELHQFKTLITRIGEKSKMILMADTDQIDEKENRKGKACPVLQMINMDVYNQSHLSTFIRLIEIERSELAALGIEICKKLDQ